MVDGLLLVSLSELIKPLILSHPWAYCHRFHDICCRTFDVLRLIYPPTVTALSAETGELLTTQNIPSSTENGSDDFFTPTSDHPRLVWIEKGIVKSVALTPKLMNKPQSLRGSADTKVLAIGLSEYGLFVFKKMCQRRCPCGTKTPSMNTTWVASGRNAVLPETWCCCLSMLTRYQFKPIKVKFGHTLIFSCPV